jgi:hypothetical protein
VNSRPPLSACPNAAGHLPAKTEMIVTPETRELARRLIACEATADEASRPTKATALRVYEKLRRRLCVLAGVAGFQSLASRALTLAKSEAQDLSMLEVAADGSLQGLGEPEPQGSDGGYILTAQLLGLLQIFLGQALTLSLVRNVWPNAALDESDSESRRKA